MAIFEYLAKIKARPGMYVGGDAEVRDLSQLETLLYGYLGALHEHGIIEEVDDFMRSFGDFIYRRTGWSTACGVASAITSNTDNPRMAWDLFWVYMAEFEVEVRKN